MYIHKLDGEVVYVGSGCKRRVTSKKDRSAEHLSVWDKLEVEIIGENLSSNESIKLEQYFIYKFWDSGKLFNKRKNVYAVKQPNFEELNEVLYYDESSITFVRWKVGFGNITAGTPAGCINNHGYVHITFKGKKYLAHRIVLLLNTKEDIPDGLVVDHIDGDRTNNLLSNLRVISPSDNQRNKKHRKSNTCIQGIYENKKYKYFAVQFREDKAIITCFSYNNKPRKSNENHYQNRELALEAALKYRNSLVDSGKIVLTNKEE